MECRISLLQKDLIGIHKKASLLKRKIDNLKSKHRQINPNNRKMPLIQAI